jgi:hypothetical protein
MGEGQARRLNPLALQAEVADLLIEQNRLLADIRDRLPAPTVARQPGRDPAEVSEPAPKQAPPSRDDSEDGPVHVAEPAPPPYRPSAPKRAPGKTTTRKR